MTQELILIVDPDDNKLGEMEKIRAHQYGMLHRAFSVFIFRKNQENLWETLLQKRSLKKYHGGGLWTNTCCSHPHADEDLNQAALSRLKNEMGIQAPLKKAGVFHYCAILDKGMIENEIDHVFTGLYQEDEVRINKEEVDDYLWISLEALHQELIDFPQKYSPWFKPALNLALKNL